MKKLFLLGMVAIGLASCSNDEVVMERNDANKINFTATTQGTSRAAQVYCNNKKFSSFNVYSPGFIAGDVVTLSDDGATWVNSVNRYWPSTGTLDFYAHVNAGTTFTTTGEKPQFVNFTPANALTTTVATTADDDEEGDTENPTTPTTSEPTVANQVDLLYAVKSSASKEKGAVALNFRHALSQIVFKAKNVSSNLHVVINGVGVHNLYGTNTYTIDCTTTDTNIEDHTGAGTDQPTNRGSWAELTGAHTTGYATAFDAVTVAKGGNVVNLTEGTEGSAAVEASEDVEAKPAVARDFSKAMLLLPQAGDALNLAAQKADNAESNGGVYFTVDCTIYNVAGAEYAASDITLYSGKIRIPADIDWAEGMKYVYTFVFGNGNGGYEPEDPDPVLVPITFTVTVDDFIEYVPTEDDDLDLDFDMETK